MSYDITSKQVSPYAPGFYELDRKPILYAPGANTSMSMGNPAMYFDANEHYKNQSISGQLANPFNTNNYSSTLKIATDKESNKGIENIINAITNSTKVIQLHKDKNNLLQDKKVA